MASEASSDALRLGASDSGGGNGGYGAPPPQPPGLGLAGLLLGAAALLAVLLPVVLGFAVAGVFALRWALSLPPGLPPGGRAGVPLHLDYLQSPPAGAACFLPPGLLLNGAVAPGAPPSSRALPPGASFDVVLTLELPDSPSNAAAGLFVVSTSVVTAAGEEVARAQRTAGLAYRSPGARLARAAARAPLLAAGLAGESQTVVLTPFEGAAHESERNVVGERGELARLDDDR